VKPHAPNGYGALLLSAISQGIYVDALWERAFPVIRIDVSQATGIFKLLDRRFEIETLEWLPGGRRNTHYHVTLKGRAQSFVLRLFAEKDQDWCLCEKERALYRLLHGQVRLPEVYLLEPDSGILDHPFGIYEFLPGMPLDRWRLAAGSEEHAGLFRQIGECLALIHGHEYPRIGFLDGDLKMNHELPPFAEWYDLFLTARVREALDADLTAACLAYLEKNTALIREMDSHVALVHGDFRPANLLVQPGELSGVIDWEGAMAGHPIADVGQFLRYPEQVTPKNEAHFIESYNLRAKTPLTRDYAERGRLRDLINLLQMLGSAPPGGYQANDLIRLIALTAAKS